MADTAIRIQVLTRENRAILTIPPAGLPNTKEPTFFRLLRISYAASRCLSLLDWEKAREFAPVLYDNESDEKDEKADSNEGKDIVVFLITVHYIHSAIPRSAIRTSS